MSVINRKIPLSHQTRKSFDYDLTYSQETQDWLYTHMLFEDIHNSVLPLGQSYSKRKNYAIVLDPPERKIEELLIKIFVSRDGYVKHNLTDAIGSFISDTAGLLAYWGFRCYEINRVVEPNNDDSSGSHKVPFRLLHIPSKVYKFLNVYIQIVPTRFWPENKKPIISIPSRSVWLLAIPSILGGGKKHYQIMRSLRLASLTVPEFVTNQMNQLAEKKEFKQDLGLPEFSFSEFHQIQKLAIAAESSLWGWPIRNLLREDTLEFYQIFRQIKFAQTKAILREYILARINDLINQELSSSKLCFKDLPNYSELKKIERFLGTRKNKPRRCLFVNRILG